jgi:mannitol 2-dehydrogenase
MPTDAAPNLVRLRNATLSQLPATVARPAYDRGSIISGIVHIGVGGFNRSHLAVYLDDLLTLGEAKPWGEFGVGLLPGDKLIHAALTEQDYLYGLLLMDSDRQSYRVIGSLTGHVFAPESCQTVIDKITSPDYRDGRRLLHRGCLPPVPRRS